MRQEQGVTRPALAIRTPRRVEGADVEVERDPGNVEAVVELLRQG